MLWLCFGGVLVSDQVTTGMKKEARRGLPDLIQYLPQRGAC